MFLLRIGLVTVTLAASVTSVLAFEISSSSVSDGKWDKKFYGDKISGCDGGNVSPALAWKDPPAGTKSFGLTLYDPDAPTGSGWWHWQAWNIPATTMSFDEGKVPDGIAQGKGDVGRTGYLGPCPLKVDKLDVDPNASGAFIGYNLNGNALGKATVVYTTPQ
jgi:Raf kinase inhibitor-like YbhB/YbcL family protein